VELRNVAADKVATISSKFEEGKLILTFEYDGSTCTFREPWGPIPDGAVCHLEYDGYTGSGYEDCVEASGFYEGTGDPWGYEGDEWEDWPFEKRAMSLESVRKSRVPAPAFRR
jgi:hypothetical protein